MISGRAIRVRPALRARANIWNTARQIDRRGFLVKHFSQLELFHVEYLSLGILFLSLVSLDSIIKIGKKNIQSFLSIVTKGLKLEQHSFEVTQRVVNKIINDRKFSNKYLDEYFPNFSAWKF